MVRKIVVISIQSTSCKCWLLANNIFGHLGNLLIVYVEGDNVLLTSAILPAKTNIIIQYFRLWTTRARYFLSLFFVN